MFDCVRLSVYITSHQTILLANWKKDPELKAGRDWLAHSYLVSVSKLEAVFGKFDSIPHESMTKAHQKRALAMMTSGKLTVAEFLLSPSRAHTRFHPSSNIFADWDKFNLKSSITVGDDGDRDFPSSKRIPSDSRPLSLTPPKRAKLAAIPDVQTASGEAVRREHEKVLKRVEEDLAEERMKLRQLEKANRLGASEVEFAKSRVVSLESELTKERARGIDQIDQLVAELDVSAIYFRKMFDFLSLGVKQSRSTRKS